MFYSYYLAALEKNSWDDITKDKIARLEIWHKESYRKVILKADDKEWEKIKEELYCFVVKDAGLTEINAGEETVLGLWPINGLV